MENEPIKSLLAENKKYFVTLRAKQGHKNAGIAIDAVRVLAEDHPEYYIVTTGGLKSQHSHHIALDYLSAGELAYTLKNAAALVFPSFIEGFGYPPQEAMRYGTPTICSFSSSIPEVVGDAGIYFNPMYASELYAALLKFLSLDREELRAKALRRYHELMEKQEKDLEALVELILSPAYY